MDKPKYSNNFNVHFDNFGSGEANEHLTRQVLTVTRPSVAFYDILGVDEFDRPSINLDLNDDISDRTRAEVVTQLHRQITEGATFSMVIETLTEQLNVIEQWRLGQCRIVEMRFSGLTRYPPEALVVHLTVQPGRISVVQFGREIDLLT